MERLEDVADLRKAEAGESVLVERGKLHAVDPDRAGRGPIEPGYQSEQRGLAASGGACDGHELARGHFEGDAVQDGHDTGSAPEPHDEVVDLNHSHLIYTVRMVSLRAAGIALALGLLSTPVAPAPSGERVVVALGDSLTAGFGVAAEEAWPALVDARLRREGYPYRVVNAGVSGDTTAGGLRRVDWVLRSRPEVAVVALGANDGLRGLGTEPMAANLLAIVDRLRAGGVRVLIAGMEVPPNYGAAYARAFRGVFPDVARRTGAALCPFSWTASRPIRA